MLIISTNFWELSFRNRLETVHFETITGFSTGLGFWSKGIQVREAGGCLVGVGATKLCLGGALFGMILN